MGTFGQIGLSLLVSSLLLNVVLCFRYVWTRKSILRTTLANLSISVFALLYLLLIMEFVFSCLSQSGDLATLASKRWFDKYWKPMNSLGYRDIEYDESDSVGKQVVFVVGDSFAAGYGIKDVEDRFSNVLQKNLKDKSLVVNISKVGWDTADEYEAILSHPAKPDVIILSYFINDCDGAAVRNGIPFAWPRANPSIRPFVKRSHLFNYAHWRAHRLRFGKKVGQDYWRYLQECYSNETVWQTHEGELLDIVNYARDQDAELVVVVFPELRNVENSKEFTSKVVDLMKQSQIDVIDLADGLAEREPLELVVSQLDGHPSVSLHREVASILFETINSMNAKEPTDGANYDAVGQGDRRIMTLAGASE